MQVHVKYDARTIRMTMVMDVNQRVENDVLVVSNP